MLLNFTCIVRVFVPAILSKTTTSFQKELTNRHIAFLGYLICKRYELKINKYINKMSVNLIISAHPHQHIRHFTL